LLFFSYFFQLFDPASTTATLHIRLNGIPVGPPTGTIIDLESQPQPPQYSWSNIIPLLSTSPTAKIHFGQDPKIQNSPFPINYFDGSIAEVAIYNYFLDPLTFDLMNLRKIEAIEWQLAYKWDFTENIAPAMPDTPQIVAISTAGQVIGPARVQLEFSPQGAGYNESIFVQSLFYVDSKTPTNIPSQISLTANQVGVVVPSLTFGESYQFWIESTLLNGCAMVNNVLPNSGNVLDVIVGQQQ